MLKGKYLLEVSGRAGIQECLSILPIHMFFLMLHTLPGACSFFIRGRQKRNGTVLKLISDLGLKRLYFIPKTLPKISNRYVVAMLPFVFVATCTDVIAQCMNKSTRERSALDCRVGSHTGAQVECSA